jgi:hypothetical protein
MLLPYFPENRDFEKSGKTVNSPAPSRGIRSPLEAGCAWISTANHQYVVPPGGVRGEKHRQKLGVTDSVFHPLPPQGDNPLPPSRGYRHPWKQAVHGSQLRITSTMSPLGG